MVSNNSATICHNLDSLRPSEPKTTLKAAFISFFAQNGALFGSSLLFLPINTVPSVLIPQHWWKFASSTVWMGSQVVSNPVYKVCKWTNGYLRRFQDIYILPCGYEVFWFAIPTKHLSNGVLLLQNPCFHPLLGFPSCWSVTLWQWCEMCAEVQECLMTWERQSHQAAAHTDGKSNNWRWLKLSEAIFGVSKSNAGSMKPVTLKHSCSW